MLHQQNFKESRHRAKNSNPIWCPSSEGKFAAILKQMAMLVAHLILQNKKVYFVTLESRCDDAENGPYLSTKNLKQ